MREIEISKTVVAAIPANSIRRDKATIGSVLEAREWEELEIIVMHYRDHKQPEIFSTEVTIAVEQEMIMV